MDEQQLRDSMTELLSRFAFPSDLDSLLVASLVPRDDDSVGGDIVTVGLANPREGTYSDDVMATIRTCKSAAARMVSPASTPKPPA